MYNRAAMKRDVKQKLAAMRPRPMWIALLYSIITSIGASVIQSIAGAVSGTAAISTQLSGLLLSGLPPEEAFAEMMLMYADRLVAFVGTLVVASLISSILVVLWQALMSLGFTGYCLSAIKGENPGVSRIFCGFPMFGKVILTALLLWVFTALWSLLYAVCFAVVMIVAALLMEAVPIVGIILMVVGYIVFIFLIIRLTLRYAMTYFFLLDEGKYGLEAITASKQMMKGKKGKLFGLYLSFIGWFLLLYVILLVGCLLIGIIIAAAVAVGGASIGAIGGAVGGSIFVFLVMMAAVWLISIWLQPYLTGSVAGFYLNFKPQEPVQFEN